MDKKIVFLDIVILFLVLIIGGFFCYEQVQASVGLDKILSGVDMVYNKLDGLARMVVVLISKINPFQAGPVVNLPQEEKVHEVVTIKEEKKNQENKKEELTPTAKEIQDRLDDVAEEIDIIEQDISEKIKNNKKDEIGSSSAEPLPIEPETKEEILEKEAFELYEEKIQEDKTESTVTSGVICQKQDGGRASRFRVLINEIAWSGTVYSADDEWIELKNVWGIPVDLSGWQLSNKDNRIRVVFGENNILAVDDFYLLERTDDNSVPGVQADAIYNGVLHNNDEILYLFDDNCRLEDEVIAQPFWLAGDQVKNKSMERLDVFYWYTYQGLAQQGIFGTPGSTNSTPPAEYIKPKSSSLIDLSTPQILITEIQIETKTSNNYDFIELFNPNAKGVDISNWELKKRTSSGHEYSIMIFPAKTIIDNRSHFLWANYDYVASGLISANATSTETLAKNNSVALFDNHNKIIDAVAWGDGNDQFFEGQPFPEDPDYTQNLGRKWSDYGRNYYDDNDNQRDFELQVPTPGIQGPVLVVDTPETGSALNVTINEIAWAGTQANHSDEWIELYNNTSTSVDITSWRLSSSGSKGIDIIFSSSTSATTTVSAQGFFLIESTDDNTIFDIQADWFGSFGNDISNQKCEIMYLYDSSGNLIDETACLGNDWPGGEASPNYISMERMANASGTDPQSWANNNLVTKNGLDADGNPINGTPRAKNSIIN